MINKPCGYVCSAASDSHKTVYELLPLELQALVKNAKRGERLHTVGRLDCNTSGLLLLTTDGNFSNYLTRPENHISKTYEAELSFPVEPSLQSEYIKRAAEGVILPAEKKAPEQKSDGARLQFITPTLCRLTITEGKFHEVRRLLSALGNRIQTLKRISIADFVLPDDLAPGNYKPLFAKKSLVCYH